jgi:hypothetical protein
LRSHAPALAGPLLLDPSRALTQLLSLEPALPAAALLLAIGSFRGRSPGWLSSLVVLGPLTIAIIGVSLIGRAFPWLRLLIVVIPLVILIVGICLATRSDEGAPGWRPRAWVGSLAAFLMIAAAVPTTLGAMLNPHTGQEELPVLQSIVGQATAASSSASTARDVAAYLDASHLGDGAVLVDSFTGFRVILSSSAPRQFLITSDRDFSLALANPAGFGVRYVLTPSPDEMSFLGSLDAINRTYPGLFQSGAASGALVREFAGPGGHAEWRLYRVSAIESVVAPTPPS